MAYLNNKCDKILTIYDVELLRFAEKSLRKKIVKKLRKLSFNRKLRSER